MLTPMSDSLISLVIPLYNQLHYTKQCIESIRRCTTVPYELILVDNGSSDGTREYLLQQEATVIANEVNLGCAKAWNQGVKASHGSVIGILNNDIVVTPGWLEELVAFLEKTNHGIVSPALREGPLTYDLDRYALEFVDACRKATRHDVHAPCFLVTRHVFEKVGLFDEGFAYGGCEDIDFFWRAKAAGFSVGITGSVLVHHFGMITQKAIKATETKTYPAVNLAYFEKKWQRTLHGTWRQRRWASLRASFIKRYERFRYGHMLLEKY